jgi:hypothetical protein
MGVEERLALRLTIRVVALLLLVVTAAAGQSYGYGTRPLWFAVAVGIPVVLLIYAGLVSRRWGAKPPGALVWDTAKRGGRRVKRLVEGVVAAVHGARRRGRVRRVELAAQETAEGDDLLAPVSVRTSGESLFRLSSWPGTLATPGGSPRCSVRSSWLSGSKAWPRSSAAAKTSVWRWSATSGSTTSVSRPPHEVTGLARWC